MGEEGTEQKKRERVRGKRRGGRPRRGGGHKFKREIKGDIGKQKEGRNLYKLSFVHITHYKTESAGVTRSPGTCIDLQREFQAHPSSFHRLKVKVIDMNTEAQLSPPLSPSLSHFLSSSLSLSQSMSFSLCLSVCLSLSPPTLYHTLSLSPSLYPFLSLSQSMSFVLSFSLAACDLVV